MAGRGKKSSGVEPRPYLRLRVQGTHYGVPVKRVLGVCGEPREVGPDMARETLGPAAAPFEALRIVDGRRLLATGEIEPPNHGAMVLLEVKDGCYGLLVDRACDVLRVAKETIQPPPGSLTLRRSRMLKGVAHVGHQPLWILRVGRVLEASLERRAHSERDE